MLEAVSRQYRERTGIDEKPAPKPKKSKTKLEETTVVVEEPELEPVEEPAEEES